MTSGVLLGDQLYRPRWVEGTIRGLRAFLGFPGKPVGQRMSDTFGRTYVRGANCEACRHIWLEY
jgi:hypothetical protein